MKTVRSPYRRWALRAVLALLAVELAWLLGVNAALSLPATQAWLNTLRPERFQVAWEGAWSAFPGHVRATGVRVSGQTPRQQWQVDAERVRGRVALWPLALRRVQVSGATLQNARYRQRPRREPGGEPDAASAWYPDIEGYEPTVQGEYPPPRPVWTITADGVRLEGRHSVWFRRFQAEFDAGATARLDTRSQGGPLALQIDGIDLRLERAWLDDGSEMLSGGTVRGAYRLGPYRYREYRGIQSLRFTDLDVDVGLEAPDLGFVKLFLLRYPALETGGRGSAEGHVSLRGGQIAEGTDLRVAASDLSVTLAPFSANGRGTVRLAATDDAALPFRVTFRFDDLAAVHADDRAPFFTGRDLRLVIDDEGVLLPAPESAGGGTHPFRAALDIDEAVVGDMRTFNRYLPDDAPMAFTHGRADLRAGLVLTHDDASGGFTLRGEDLGARLADQELGLALRFDGVLAGGRPTERRLDLSGSVLTLHDARVIGEESRFEETDWSARAVFDEARLVLDTPIDLELETTIAVSDTRPLAAMFINRGGPAWVARHVHFEDVAGAARLRLNDRRLFIPGASLSTEHLEAGMRGVMGAPANEGMVYLRYRRLDALLHFEGGRSDVTVFDPKGKFEAYEVSLPAAP